jgi:UDP-N-acetylglucosamine 2-epimerase
MIRKKIVADLEPWLARASSSLIASFASSIAKDRTAVVAAISSPWSNGQTEGQIPEEINRRIVDHISDYNLPYSRIAREYLLREGRRRA